MRTLLTLLLSTTIAVAQFRVQEPDNNQGEQAVPASFWSHNGSTMYLVASGDRREFYYQEPRWEGLWATSRDDCLDEEGPNSRTFIGRKNSDSGRRARLFDQYENHCRIDSYSKKGAVTTMNLSCFEFWENYKRKANARRSTIILEPVNQETLLINEMVYVRCKE
jgi:hypothetical protein